MTNHMHVLVERQTNPLHRATAADGVCAVLQLDASNLDRCFNRFFYDPWILAVLVIPHATLEFAALLLGAAISIWLVFRTVQDAMSNEFHLVRNLRRIIPYVAFSVGLILLGAIVEVYITPLIGAQFLSESGKGEYKLRSRLYVANSR